MRGVDYLAALESRKELYATVEDIIMQHGQILTPAAPGPAPKGLASTGDPVFCAFWTYLGVQLIGVRRDDGRLLRSARWLARQLAEAA